MKHNKFYVVIISLIASIGGLLLGFSASISGAQDFYKTFFELPEGSFWIGFSVSASMFGTFIGNFFAGTTCDKLGRRKSLMLAAILFSFCTIGSGLSDSFVLFLITRFIGGLGIGISLLVVPLYIAEIAPSKQRGFLVSFNQLNIVIGISANYFINYGILKMISDPDLTWRWMLGIGFVPAVIYFILLFLIPESPRWLIQKGKEDDAKKTMLRIGGEEHAENEFKQIKSSLIAAETKKEKSSWGELFNNKMWLILVIGLTIAFFQQISGINAIFFFLPKIFRLAGGSEAGSLIQATMVGVTNVVMTVAAMFLIDRIGRKPLLLTGVSIIIVSLLITAFSFKNAKYQIKSDAINLICNSVIEDAIKSEAKKINPGNYNIDKIEYADSNVILYKNGNIAASLSMNSPEIKSAKNEAGILNGILKKIENKQYDKEIDFFKYLKTNIESAVNSGVLKVSANNKTNNDAAFYEAIKIKMKDNNNTHKISKSIADVKYSYYKDKILENSISINSLLVLIAIIGFVIGFAISLGPITWTLLSEIFPNKVRGLGISIAGTLNGITSFVVATIFPAELENLGSSATYFIYAGFMIAFIFIVIKFFPETKGKSLEEIENILIKQ
ncbi:MAG: sugar porter family MFS transporter [Bacteroidales bacterium]|nr:sugar porter family MFS transporter [Bacteroidales bacterium]